MTTIYTPDRQYHGLSAGIQFTNGQAEVDEAANPGAMAYFRRTGYGIGQPAATRTAETSGSYEGPSTEPYRYLGTPLRDAAVDPMPQDFLPPINAGKADPHGPLVVAPGLHGVPPAPIRPGEVFVHDTDRQQLEETELAKRVLVDGEPATIVQTMDRSGDVSDARETGPGPSAKKADWVTYAESQGIPRDEAEDLTIAAIRERLGP